METCEAGRRLTRLIDRISTAGTRRRGRHGFFRDFFSPTSFQKSFAALLLIAWSVPRERRTPASRFPSRASQGRISENLNTAILAVLHLGGRMACWVEQLHDRQSQP